MPQIVPTLFFQRLQYFIATTVGGLLILVLTIGSVSWSYHHALNFPTLPYTLTIAKGQTIHSLIRLLSEEKLVNKPWMLRIGIKLFAPPTLIQYGEYEFTQPLSFAQILHALHYGKDRRQYPITLIEGTDFATFYRDLQTHSELRPITGDLSSVEIVRLLDINMSTTSAEGLFFADTYLFGRDTMALTILRQAHQQLQDQLHALWEQRRMDLPYQSAYEALIMASMIEKETGQAAERERIAGVFVNRLQRGMRLQSDPTVIYGLGESFDGDLRRRHLRDRNNAHNTYVHSGLPPTPIAMVGRAALEAAFHPMTTDELYFVAKGDGSHQFSTTLEAHHAAVQRYQRRPAANYRSSP